MTEEPYHGPPRALYIAAKLELRPVTAFTPLPCLFSPAGGRGVSCYSDGPIAPYFRNSAGSEGRKDAEWISLGTFFKIEQ